MDKQKQQQTEELYNDLSSIMNEEYEKRMLITPSYCANKMLEKGYRKIPENAVVLTSNQKISLEHEWYRLGYEQSRKETAEKFAEVFKTKLFDLRNVVTETDIDEICKEIIGEV